MGRKIVLEGVRQRGLLGVVRDRYLDSTPLERRIVVALGCSFFRFVVIFQSSSVWLFVGRHRRLRGTLGRMKGQVSSSMKGFLGAR